MKKRYVVVFEIELDNPPSCFSLSQEKIAERLRWAWENERMKVKNVTVTEMPNETTRQ